MRPWLILDLGPAGLNAETLRKWVRQAEVDAVEAAGMSSEDKRELRELRRKNRELEQTIAILSELDRLAV